MKGGDVMLRWAVYLRGRSKATLTLWSIALVALIGLLDYVTGAELAFSIFYLLPVALAAWFVDRRGGLWVSALAAATWFVADVLAGHVYLHPAIPYWNSAVRLGFFLIVTLILSALQTSRARQEEMTRFIVHDLRSPLANVITGLEVLQEEPLNDVQHEMMQLSLDSCHAMLMLVNSILDLARLQDGRMRARPESASAERLIKLAFGQVSLWAGERHLQLLSQVDADAETIHADGEMTVRVLVNLLSNAIKHSPPGSEISVRATRREGRWVALSVTDRGTGIAKEWAEKVFDPYTRADALDSGSALGTGLGLTFCREAVAAQGGRIWLEGAPQGGAPLPGVTVTFTLPAGDAE
jgi:signal transduction histidine kinase